MADQPKDINEKTVFALLPDGLKNDPAPVIIVGIPEKAWENLRAGNCSTFDLTKAGFPAKIVLFGSADHDAAMKVIETTAAQNGTALIDDRRKDFSMKISEAK